MEDANIRIAEEQVTYYNMGLAVVQLCCGLTSGSAIMLADSLYSAFHAFGGIKEGMYRKRDIILSVFLTLMFLVVAAVLIVVNIRRMITGRYLTMGEPGIIVIVVCAGSILLKKLLNWHLIYQALEYQSSLLMAAAWHQKQGIVLFGISILGLCLTKMGFMWAEPVTSMIVSLMFLRSALVL